MALTGIIETKLFTRIWDHFGLTANDLIAMQDECLDQLKNAPVVPGCAGVRKMRFSPSSVSTGKRGAFRVLFKYLEDYEIVVLLLAYPKSVKENITAEDRKTIIQAVESINIEFTKRFKKKSGQ
jgi:hypothetical protein